MVKKKKWILLAAVCLVAAAAAGGLMAYGRSADVRAVPAAVEMSFEEDYQNYLDEHHYDGGMAQDTIQVDLNRYTVSDGMEASVGEEGILTEDEGTITWSFDVKETGFYNLELGYIPLPGTTSDIQRKVSIDGETPYESLSQVVIKRWWQDEEIVKKNENEIRPEALEVYADTKWFLEGYNRRNNGPLLFYLK